MTPTLKTPFKHSANTDQPLYGQIMDWLQQCIKGEFEDGQRFLTERELMALLNVSQASVRRALQELVDRGMLRRHVGRGTFVQKLKKIRQLGIIVPKSNSVILMQQISCFADLCDEFDCNLRVYHISPGTITEELRDSRSTEHPPSIDIARLLSANPEEERMVLLGHSHEATLALYRELNGRGFRTVSALPFAEEYPGQSVTIDVRQSVELAFNHLLDLGHRNIALLVNEPTALANISVRLNHIHQFAEEKGLAQSLSVVDCHTHMSENSFESALRKMPDLLRQCPQATAIVPISGVGALAVLRYAGVHGLRVPQDMSLLAFDDLPGFDMHYPAITAIRNDGHTYARSVLQMLWTEEAGQTPRHKTIPLSLIVRESTAQAK